MDEPIRIGYTFRDPALLTQALTHRSFIRENGCSYAECNERLEFLGDSLLNMLTAEYLFTRFPEREEGELTKLRALVVCEQALYIAAVSFGLSAGLRLGRGEESNGGRSRPSILADSVEAVLAAVYLDGGMDAARAFVRSFIPGLVDMAEADKLRYRDHKTVLQEIVQKTPGHTLRYEILHETGPDHDKRFEIGVFLDGQLRASGSGKSKKEAEQTAAAELVRILRQEK